MMGPQKFFRGQRVRIGKMPWDMAHFTGECEAIILCSYSDHHVRHGPENDHVFQVLLLKNGKPLRTSAWYPDNLFELINSDRDAGEQLLQDYKFMK